MISSRCFRTMVNRLPGYSRNASQARFGADQSAERWQSPYKLVIFDKDGTLTSFDAMWGPWSEHNVSKLEQKTGKKLSDDLYQYFNYDADKKKFGKSCFGHDTQAVVRMGILDIMSEKHGIPAKEAESIFDQCWVDTFEVAETSVAKTVEPLGDVQEIFSELKKHEIKTAVCSSDGRESVERTLKVLGIFDEVDKIVCGDDVDNTPKPAPDNVHMICKSLGVDPKDTVVVGDTRYDTEMGRKSDCGLVIGLLSGLSDKSDLKDADYVTTALDDILPIIFHEKKTE